MRHLLTAFACFFAMSLSAQIEFPYNPDFDADEFIGTADLLELLTLFGSEFSPDELMLSADSSSLIVYVGDLDKMKCASACVNLEGNWRNLTSMDLAKHYDQLAIYPPLQYGGFDDAVYMWYSSTPENSGYKTNPIPWELDARTRNSYTNNDGVEYPAFWQGGNNGFEDSNMLITHECWCVTHQRPRVEFHQISDSEFDDLKEELSNEGWRLHSSNAGKVYFWRWAE